MADKEPDPSLVDCLEALRREVGRVEDAIEVILEEELQE